MRRTGMTAVRCTGKKQGAWWRTTASITTRHIPRRYCCRSVGAERLSDSDRLRTFRASVQQPLERQSLLGPEFLLLMLDRAISDAGQGSKQWDILLTKGTLHSCSVCRDTHWAMGRRR